MAGFKKTIDTAQGWLKSLFEFGLAVIMVFVVIDILFPGTTGIIENIGATVAAFADEGVVGLIALFLFVLIYRR